MPIVKAKISEEMKEMLEEYVSSHNMTLAECIRYCIEAQLQADPVLPEMTHHKEANDKVIKVYCSPAEYAEIVSRAAGHPLSQYIRHTVLSSSTPIEITLYTEDVQQLTLQLSTFTGRLVKYLNGAKYRGEISEVDVDYLKGLLQNILDLMREYVHQTRKNQTAIRNAGMRHLRKQINDAIRKEKGGKQK